MIDKRPLGCGPKKKGNFNFFLPLSKILLVLDQVLTILMNSNKNSRKTKSNFSYLS